MQSSFSGRGKRLFGPRMLRWLRIRENVEDSAA
jgi:hypothetical protein